MASQIFLIIDIVILVILPYIRNYFVTSELYIRPSNTNTRNNDPIQNNNNSNKNDDNINYINNNNHYDFNNHISQYYQKISKSGIFCFHNFGAVIAAQGVICHPRVRKGVYSKSKITSDLK